MNVVILATFAAAKYPISLMRTNLKVPFAEKDAAKALGARWDPAKKVWYIVDVEVLTPFQKWIPDLDGWSANEGSDAAQLAKPPAKAAKSSSEGVITVSTTNVQHCGCKVLPWVDCEHTASG